MELTEQERAIIMGLGVHIRVRFDRPFTENPDEPLCYISNIDGSGIFGEGVHATDPREAMRLAWGAYWRMAQAVVQHRLEHAPRDPVAIAITKHRRGA